MGWGRTGYRYRPFLLFRNKAGLEQSDSIIRGWNEGERITGG